MVRSFLKKTLAGFGTQFTLPFCRLLGRYFTARPRFSLVCTTQLNLIIAWVSGAGLFLRAMEEISPLRMTPSRGLEKI